MQIEHFVVGMITTAGLTALTQMQIADVRDGLRHTILKVCGKQEVAAREVGCDPGQFSRELNTAARSIALLKQLGPTFLSQLMVEIGAEQTPLEAQYADLLRRVSALEHQKEIA
jgi:hypothetical protein